MTRTTGDGTYTQTFPPKSMSVPPVAHPAERHLRETIAALSRIVADRCDGSEDFVGVHMDTLRRCYHDLLKVRDEAGTIMGWAVSDTKAGSGAE